MRGRSTQVNTAVYNEEADGRVHEHDYQYTWDCKRVYSSTQLYWTTSLGLYWRWEGNTELTGPRKQTNQNEFYFFFFATLQNPKIDSQLHLKKKQFTKITIF